jgi:hypothetical protein
MRNHANLVYIIDDEVYGTIVGRMGAYYTTVVYVKGGMEYEVLLENDEFELMEDEIIEHDD